MNELFQQLLSPDFANRSLFASTTDALVLVLERDVAVQRINAGFQRGEVTEQDVSDLVDRILLDYRKGQAFPGDIILAALAVAMKFYFGAFSERFLSELSTIKAAELPRSSRVAKLVYTTRSKVQNQERAFHFQGPPLIPEGIVVRSAFQDSSREQKPSLADTQIFVRNQPWTRSLSPQRNEAVAC